MLQRSTDKLKTGHAVLPNSPELEMWLCHRRPGGLTLQAAALKGVQAVRLIFPLLVKVEMRSHWYAVVPSIIECHAIRFWEQRIDLKSTGYRSRQPGASIVPSRIGHDSLLTVAVAS